MADDKKKKIHFYGLCLGIILLVACVAYFGWSLSGAGYNEERQYTDSSNVSAGLQHTADELDAARTQQQDLNNQVKKLQEQLSQSTKQVQVLDSQSVTLNSQVQTLQEQLSQSRQEVQTLKRDLIQSQNALTNAKVSLTSTTQAVQDQEKQYRKNERALKRQVSAWKVATVAAFFLGLKIDF